MEEKQEVQNSESEEKVIEEKEEENKQVFDYKKEREERIKNRTEKAIFNELGVKSLEEIKKNFNLISDYEKQIEELEKQVNEGKNNQYKVQVLKAGIDEEFLDYVVDKLKKEVSEKEDFKTVLEKFKEKHPRYLKQAENRQIRVNTAPNLENISKGKNFSEKFNEIIRRKVTKER